MKAINFGIDLGTTNSLIAKYENGQVVIYKNPIGFKESLPSVVAFRPDRILVGDKAREYLIKDPVNIFANFKRRMGTDDKFYVVNLDENITPIELSAKVLKELTGFVYSGENVEAAVITIPASFDTMQSNATKKAGKLAGFQEVFLLQEPIAASLAYFNGKKGAAEEEGYWLVYDLGGGTFDVALMSVKDGEMKVVDHEGNNFLGGSDFDLALIEKILAPAIAAKTGIADFEETVLLKHGKYEAIYYELLYKAEEAKKELSLRPETFVEISIKNDGQIFDLDIRIKKEDFEALISERISESVKMLKEMLVRNKLPAEMIHEILLVGGSTYIPFVRTFLKENTGIPINTSVDPTTAVVIGAAYYAANKHFQPKNASGPVLSQDVDSLLKELSTETLENETQPIDIVLSYSKMSKDVEEVLIVKSEGEVDQFQYRIIRSDGGFDTGVMKLRSKFTEFLPLMRNVNNQFFFKLYDAQQNELKDHAKTIEIAQGQFQIAGQPLPKDVCIEVDDAENHTTKLEVIFGKNSVLPQKKTLYREISKTIKKDSDDRVIINIMEGDRNARPLSNLVIACIEISGKDLNSDLLKGSDIELQITMNDDREISVQSYLVMTQQEFKNVFSLSEKQVSIPRLKEQYIDLENEMRNTAKYFSREEDDAMATQVGDFIDELEASRKDILRLNDNDRTDRKYVLAEMLSRMSQSFDKLGGESRMEALRYEYLEAKEFVEQHIGMVDFKKDELQQKFQKLLAGEQQVLLSKNPSILQRATERMNSLGWDIWWNTLSYLISKFEGYKHLSDDAFTNAKAARMVINTAQSALDNERFHEFRQHLYNLTHLMVGNERQSKNRDFKGTGIG